MVCIARPSFKSTSVNPMQISHSEAAAIQEKGLLHSQCYPFARTWFLQSAGVEVLFDRNHTQEFG